MLEYKIEETIKYRDDIDKKWQFLQFVYNLHSQEEFEKETFKIIENNEVSHKIYVGITEEEFLRYIYFLDVERAVLRGKNADCDIVFETGEIVLKYFDHAFDNKMYEYIDNLNALEIEPMDENEFKMYFYVPENDNEFYYQFIQFIYYMSDTYVKKYGIKICSPQGKFETYNDLRFPRENLHKFLYYDKDNKIFIGSHSKNNMIVTFNLPRNKLLELRRWCNEYQPAT